MESLRIQNFEKIAFDCGDIIQMEIDCTTKRDWTDVAFRFEIKFQDGVKVGTMLSSGTVDRLEAGHNKIRIQLNTVHLTPGRYVADIIAYNFNELGQEQFLDGVYPGVVFEISDKINEHNKLNWLHQYWGNVHLHDVDVEKM